MPPWFKFEIDVGNVLALGALIWAVISSANRRLMASEMLAQKVSLLAERMDDLTNQMQVHIRLSDAWQREAHGRLMALEALDAIRKKGERE